MWACRGSTGTKRLRVEGVRVGGREEVGTVQIDGSSVEHAMSAQEDIGKQRGIAVKGTDACLLAFSALIAKTREAAAKSPRSRPPLSPHTLHKHELSINNKAEPSNNNNDSLLILCSSASCLLKFLSTFTLLPSPPLPPSLPPLPYHLPESTDPPPLLLPPPPVPLLLGEGVLLLLKTPSPPPTFPPFFPPLLPSLPTSLCNEALRQSMLKSIKPFF